MCVCIRLQNVTAGHVTAFHSCISVNTAAGGQIIYHRWYSVYACQAVRTHSSTQTRGSQLLVYFNVLSLFLIFQAYKMLKSVEVTLWCLCRFFNRTIWVLKRTFELERSKCVIFATVTLLILPLHDCKWLLLSPISWLLLQLLCFTNWKGTKEGTFPAFLWTLGHNGVPPTPLPFFWNKQINWAELNTAPIWLSTC